MFKFLKNSKGLKDTKNTKNTKKTSAEVTIDNVYQKLANGEIDSYYFNDFVVCALYDNLFSERTKKTLGVEKAVINHERQEAEISDSASEEDLLVAYKEIQTIIDNMEDFNEYFSEKYKAATDAYLKMEKKAIRAEINGERPEIDENAYKIISIEDMIKKTKAYEGSTTKNCSNPAVIKILFSGLLVTLSCFGLRLSYLIHFCKYST